MGDLQPLVIVGGGGHAREVLDVVAAVNAIHQRYRVLGYVALTDSPALRQRGLHRLGDDEVLGRLAAAYVVAIGAPGTRARVDARATACGLRAAALVHPSATVGSRVRLGPGVVVAAGARVTTDVDLGRHVHLNANATVAHDGVLGDHVTVGPQAALCGGVVLGERVAVGAGSTVVQGVRVGAGSTVGAGAVVVADLPAGVTAVGVPARPLAGRRSAHDPGPGAPDAA